MKKHLLIAVLLITATGMAQDIESFFSKTDAFLQANVANGKVAYSKIYENQEALSELMRIADKISVSESDAKNYQAFWINAYNIATIKGIIDNYPTKSPLDNAGFFDKTTYSLAGKTITLNDIENKILRAKFKDPRFHFVLVCGALGCPPLISEAYLPNTLDAQLDEQTKMAINGNFIKVNTKKKRVEGSEILKWYKEDFVMNGNEIDFLNTYRTEKIPTNFKLSHFTYNWKLNEQ